MTRLERGKKVKRTVSSIGFGDLVVTADETGLWLRQKGRRTTYGPIAWGRLYQLGALDLANAVRREKAQKKKLAAAARRNR